MHTDSNTEFQNLIPVITSNVSSNRIKIQEILSILQLETDYFSKLFISEYSIRSSDTTVFTETSRTAILHEEVLQDSSALMLHVHITENSPSRIQFYMQKAKSSSSTTIQFQKFYA